MFCHQQKGWWRASFFHKEENIKRFLRKTLEIIHIPVTIKT